jgi:small-conductance mechanosensitive channel
MLYPLWKVRDWSPGLWGSLLFFSTLVAVGIAANLRFHLLFTSRFSPAELVGQRDLVFTWVRWSDWIFVLLLLVAAGLIAGAHAGTATLLVAVAVGSFIAFMIIEPATTRAAFRRSLAKTPRPRGGRRTPKSGVKKREASKS